MRKNHFHLTTNLAGSNFNLSKKRTDAPSVIHAETVLPYDMAFINIGLAHGAV
jgi:hypothetical protein